MGTSLKMIRQAYLRPPYSNELLDLSYVKSIIPDSVDLANLIILDIESHQLFPAYDVRSDEELYAAMPFLSEVLAGNNLLDFATFYGFPQLKRLDLQSNFIRLLPPLPVDCFQHLENLDLTANCIDNSSSLDTLSMLPALKNLNLSYNNLKNFDFDNLDGFPMLSVLNLRGNRLTDAAICFGIQNLREINLSGNRLKQVQIPEWDCLISLYNVNLSANRIKLLENIEELGKIPSLRILDLTGNGICKRKKLRTLFGPNCMVIIDEGDLEDSVCEKILLDVRNNSDYPKIPIEYERSQADDGNPVPSSSKGTRTKRPSNPGTELTPTNPSQHYEIPSEEIEQLTAGWENLPPPDTLRQCYKEIDEILKNPRKATVGLATRKAPARSSRLGSVKIDRFWTAVGRHRQSMQKNFLRTDRLSIPEGLQDIKKELKFLSADGKDKNKENRIKTGLAHVKEVNRKTFEELLDYRVGTQQHRKKLQQTKSSDS